MKNQEEIWKDIVGYNGVYQVSNKGRVKSLKFNKERILSKGVFKSKIPAVSLSKNCKYKTFKIHQLVAESFLNHSRCGHSIVVDHIDNNPSNNNLENLQLISSRLNTSKDSWRNKKSGLPLGVTTCSSLKNPYMTQIQVNGKSKYLGVFATIEECLNAYQTALKQLI